METIIPTDAASIFDVLKKLKTLDRAAIVRPNNPPPGIAGFLFDLVQDDSAELTSDITDHYVEDNTAIHDQIGLRPEVFSVRGAVAELTDSRFATNRAATIPDALPLNAPLEPDLAPQAEEMQNDVVAAEEGSTAAITSQQSLYDYFNAQSAQQPDQTRQTKVFLYFYHLWKARMLLSFETPWGIATNLAIQSVRSEQGEDSRGASEFRLTLKKVRFATSLVITDGQLAGRAVPQMAPVTENGNAGQRKLTAKDKESLLLQLAKTLGITP